MPINSVEDARQALAGALPFNLGLTPDAHKVLSDVLEASARRLLATPHLEDAAMVNASVLRARLFDRAVSGPLEEAQVRLALRDICPLFPFC